MGRAKWPAAAMLALPLLTGSWFLIRFAKEADPLDPTFWLILVLLAVIEGTVWLIIAGFLLGLAATIVTGVLALHRQRRR